MNLLNPKKTQCQKRASGAELRFPGAVGVAVLVPSPFGPPPACVRGFEPGQTNRCRRSQLSPGGGRGGRLEARLSPEHRNWVGTFHVVKVGRQNFGSDAKVSRFRCSCSRMGGRFKQAADETAQFEAGLSQLSGDPAAGSDGPGLPGPDAGGRRTGRTGSCGTSSGVLLAIS